MQGQVEQRYYPWGFLMRKNEEVSKVSYDFFRR